MTIAQETPLSTAQLQPPLLGFRARAALLAAYVLLTILVFPVVGFWPLAFVATAPLALCVVQRPLLLRYLGQYYLAGAAFFLLGLHWLIPVAAAGYVALCLYLALYTVLFAVVLQRLHKALGLPAVLAVPVALTAAQYLRGTVLTGLPWFNLGVGLAPAPWLIQVADVAGVSGLTFFAAMGSGAITDAFTAWRSRETGPRRRAAFSAVGFLVAFVAVAAYGLFRLSQPLLPGPRIAVVQSNVPESLKETSDAAQQRQMVTGLLALSGKAATSHPLLIAWPETMVPGYLNKSFLDFPKYELTKQGRREVDRSRSFNDQLQSFVHRTGCNLLVGAAYLKMADHPANDIKKNIAVLYTPHSPHRQIYSKHHLVPFGEYVPFRRSFPWLHRLLLSLTPFGPNDDYSLNFGRHWRRFRISAGKRSYRFGAPICYEDVMPHPARMFNRPRQGKKQVNFLVSISNDGWYESPSELWQHLQFDQLRAVEERVPIARSVNTGNSGFVDSDGRVIRLVNVGGKSMFVSGFAVARLPLDARVSLYSRWGDWFGRLCTVAAGVGVAVSWLPRFRRRGGKPAVAPA